MTNDEEPFQPAPMLSPDRRKFWNGTAWQLLPGEISEWDGHQWQAKPTGGESKWNGNSWVVKPSEGDFKWNGHEWAPDLYPPPEGVESRWDGSKWAVKPADNSQWDGNQWVTPKPKLSSGAKIAIGATAAILLLMLGGVAISATDGGNNVESSSSASDSASDSGPIASKSATAPGTAAPIGTDPSAPARQQAAADAGWTRDQTIETADQIVSAWNTGRKECDSGHGTPGCSAEYTMPNSLPPGVLSSPASEILKVTPLYIKGDKEYVLSHGLGAKAFNIADPAGNSVCISYGLPDGSAGMGMLPQPCTEVNIPPYFDFTSLQP